MRKNFSVEIDLTRFLDDHKGEFEMADLEEQEDKLDNETIRLIEEEYQKQSQSDPDKFLSSSLRTPSEKHPSLIEKLSLLSPIRFEFAGLGNCQSVCQLFISIKSNVVIASEMEDNPGTSITNAAASLASEVCARFRLNPKKLLWIQHDSNQWNTGEKIEEEFSLVKFETDRDGIFRNPVWTYLPQPEVENLLVLLD